MKTNYIYLLQEREFIKTKENIYKLGMTQKENLERFNQYPKGSSLLLQIICNNCRDIEKNLIKIFKNTFKQRKDIGSEYFEGNSNEMIDIIYSIIKNENSNTIKVSCNISDDKIKVINFEMQPLINESSDVIKEENNYINKITTYNELNKFNNITDKVIITNRQSEDYLVKFGNYLCNICGKEYKYKSEFERHKNKIIPCKKREDSIHDIYNKLLSDFKDLKNINDLLKEQNNNLKDTNEFLKKENNNLKDKNNKFELKLKKIKENKKKELLKNNLNNTININPVFH